MSELGQLTFDNHVYVDPPPESEDSDERYTTPETMAWCHNKAKVTRWDLDAAACVESHWANLYYTKERSGLDEPWVGRTWCNPPWSQCGEWVAKAWIEIQREKGPLVIGMLLPGNRTEQPWWHDLVEPYRDIPRGRSYFRTHFLPGRTQYGCPGNPKAIGVGSPNFTSVFLVWRRPGAGRGKP